MHLPGDDEGRKNDLGELGTHIPPIRGWVGTQALYQAGRCA
jgi:hypothetical protein